MTVRRFKARRLKKCRSNKRIPDCFHVIIPPHTKTLNILELCMWKCVQQILSLRCVYVCACKLSFQSLHWQSGLPCPALPTGRRGVLSTRTCEPSLHEISSQSLHVFVLIQFLQKQHAVLCTCRCGASRFQTRSPCVTAHYDAAASCRSQCSSFKSASSVAHLQHFKRCFLWL